MNAQEFEDLVAKAIELLNEGSSSEGFDGLSNAARMRSITQKTASGLCLRNTSTAYLRGLDGMIEVDKAEYLQDYFGSACEIPQMFDALMARLADELDNGTPLHPVAAQWLASVLREDVTRPSRPGRSSTEWRDIQIGLTIEAIAQYTDHPTGGATSKKVSAIDVVQVALGRSEIASLGNDRLKDIWEKFQRERLIVELPSTD